MRIDFIEIQNFRRLSAVRIDFSDETTLFVGANNSGKTSAITSLRYFLIQKNAFSVYDIPLHLWEHINEIGEAFDNAEEGELPHKWKQVLPSLDVWLKIIEGEIHHVAHLIPTLDWNPDEGIGVRLQLEPKNPEELLKNYITAKNASCETLEVEKASKSPDISKGEQSEEEMASEQTCKSFSLWPENLMDFLKKRMSGSLKVNAYLLDPSKKETPICGVAQPQKLPDDAEPLDDDPFKALIKIDEVPAHRDLSDYSGTREDSDEVFQGEKGNKQLLTAQL